MKNTKIKILLAFVLSTLMLVNRFTFAADFAFSEAPKIVEQNSSGINISWEKVDGATGYLVMYSTKSSSGSAYEFELPDLTESTGATISNLESGKTYYIAVSAFDSELNEVTSPELTATYSGIVSAEVSNSEDSKFTMKNVEVLSSKELKVSFSNQLNSDATASKEFMLTPKDNKNAEIAISDVVIQGSDVILALSEDLTTSTEYELVAISVSDVNGNTIESGVDGMVAFSSPSDFGSENTEVELHAAANEEVMPETTVEENIAPVVEETTGTGNASEVAQDAEALPTTGPKEMMFVILALMLGGVVAFVTRRKA